MNKKKNDVKKIDLLSVSLWLFLALSLDIAVHLITSAIFSKEIIYRAAISKSITIIIWIVAVMFAIKYIRRHNLKELYNTIFDIRNIGFFIAMATVLIVINFQVKALGTIQVIHEFEYMSKDFGAYSTITFILQIIYYCLEASLVALIVIFGNGWGRNKYNSVYIPYGGIVLGLTWGAVHFLSKNLEVGLYGICISMIIGVGFLLTRRNLVLTYILSLMLFII